MMKVDQGKNPFHPLPSENQTSKTMPFIKGEKLRWDRENEYIAIISVSVLARFQLGIED